MTSHELQAQTPNARTRIEGVTVIGEAVRRVAPESAEFLIEIAASAPTAAQALRDHQAKTAQVARSAGALGVEQADMQSISLNVYNLFTPVMQALPAFAGIPQIGQGEMQFGTYQARSTLRVNVREPGRVGEVVDSVARAGASVIGGFSFRVSDDAAARRATLEAAGRDARAKAETLATAAGKKVGDAVAISEDIVASDGALAAIRSAVPFAFGGAASPVSGELEYYARVSANFRLQ